MTTRIAMLALLLVFLACPPQAGASDGRRGVRKATEKIAALWGSFRARGRQKTLEPQFESRVAEIANRWALRLGDLSTRERSRDPVQVGQTSPLRQLFAALDRSEHAPPKARADLRRALALLADQKPDPKVARREIEKLTRGIERIDRDRDGPLYADTDLPFEVGMREPWRPPTSQLRTQVLGSQQPELADIKRLVAQRNVDPSRVAVINLRMETNSEKAFATDPSLAGISLFHEPILDDAIPSTRQLTRILATIASSSFDLVLFHCALGISRTGMVEAAVKVVHHGYSIDHALRHTTMRGAVQPEFVRRFATQWLTNHVPTKRIGDRVYLWDQRAKVVRGGGFEALDVVSRDLVLGRRDDHVFIIDPKSGRRISEGYDTIEEKDSLVFGHSGKRVYLLDRGTGQRLSKGYSSIESYDPTPGPRPHFRHLRRLPKRVHRRLTEPFVTARRTDGKLDMLTADGLVAEAQSSFFQDGDEVIGVDNTELLPRMVASDAPEAGGEGVVCSGPRSGSRVAIASREKTVELFFADAAEIKETIYWWLTDTLRVGGERKDIQIAVQPPRGTELPTVRYKVDLFEEGSLDAAAKTRGVAFFEVSPYGCEIDETRSIRPATPKASASPN